MSEPSQLSRESLSAVMDGEGSVFESKRLSARMGDDGELRATWVRYQAVSAVLHKQAMSNVNSLAFADRVQQAITAEQVQTAASISSVKARRWPRWAGQIAVAASCAAVAVGVTTWQMQGSQTQLQVAEAVNTVRQAQPAQQTVVANAAAPKLMDTPLLSPVSALPERKRLQWLEARPEVSPVNYTLPMAPTEQ